MGRILPAANPVITTFPGYAIMLSILNKIKASEKEILQEYYLR